MEGAGSTLNPHMAQGLKAQLKEAVPETAQRIHDNTDGDVNNMIRLRSLEKLRQSAENRGGIDQRLQDLEEEWDIERTLMANAAGVSLLGTVIGLTFNRKFLVLPGVVAGFLMQHALQGWCPPLALFRRMGVRSAREIENERAALKALRGDFEKIEPGDDPFVAAQRALAAAEKA